MMTLLSPAITLARGILLICLLLLLRGADVRAQETVRRPFVGVTHVMRVTTSPRDLRMHIVTIDLFAPGIRVAVTPPGGPRETIRQTTLQFLEETGAQIAINAHFFLPFPSASPFASVIGLAASNGIVYSGFETPEQSYALVAHAPAINIDANNRASIVHARVDEATTEVVERASLWNAVAGSAQIVTNGVKSIPVYRETDRPNGTLISGGPGEYSNRRSWYDQLNARTAIGLANRQRTLLLFTVDRASGSLGMSVGEVADLLIREFRVEQALNLDGGGSTTLAMEDPATGRRAIVNAVSDDASGRPVGSSLAIFAHRR
jgi:hypothetical protein